VVQKLQEVCEERDKEFRGHDAIKATTRRNNTSFIRNFHSKPFDFDLNRDSPDSLLLLPMTIPKSLSSGDIVAEKGDMSTPSIDEKNTQQDTDVEVEVSNYEDKYTLICETRSESGTNVPFSLNDCVKLDTETGWATFIDPDPRELYLSDRRPGGAEGGEVLFTAQGTEPHSMEWWGLQPSCRLKVRLMYILHDQMF
jgi:hypothetical protein